MKQKVSVINLGCARNLVDAQFILGYLKKKGCSVVDVMQAETVIVNTCAFIDDAKRESIDTILDLIELKKQGKLKKIVVAGCLAQRYGAELTEELKEIDAVTGVLRLDKEKIFEQVTLTPEYSRYLKICESCYNSCSFCVIPAIKGKFVSRTQESILEEIRQMDALGVKEINVIGQDITAYGMDIYQEKRLAVLLKKIARITENIKWLRLLYTFPSHVTDELIDVVASEEKICKYIDLPLQHINDGILQRMNRNITKKEVIDLINKIRSKIASVALRTTFIVGFPGETEENFKELEGFLKDARFERASVFAYSREEGTPAGSMPGQIPENIKRERLDILMRAQRDISKSVQKEFIGQSLQVLIEESSADVSGRTQYDAPEVDGVVHIYSPTGQKGRLNKKLMPGDFVSVNVTDSYEYDLVGELA